MFMKVSLSAVPFNYYKIWWNEEKQQQQKRKELGCTGKSIGACKCDRKSVTAVKHRMLRT